MTRSMDLNKMMISQEVTVEIEFLEGQEMTQSGLGQ